MIVDLPDTTTGAVAKKIVDLRDAGGAVALGRVMTLLIVTDDGPAEEAIRAANDASREHPCRVIAIVRGNKRGVNRLDAQIRVGGDAGASEVIVLRLYGPLAEHGESVVVPFLLPDAPIVAWWPGVTPDVPADDAIGRMAQRRITDASQSKNPVKALQQRAARHHPGDTDLAWSRITLWRGLLAAALDEPPYEPVQRAVVSGGPDSASTDLLAAWLGLYLKCPVKRVRTPVGSGMVGVVLERASGPVELVRPDGNVATLTQPGQPERRIALARRQDRDCLAEELRRLDPDDIFGEVVTRGLDLLAKNGTVGTTRSGGAKQSAATSAGGHSGARRTPGTPPVAPVHGPDDGAAAPDDPAPAEAVAKAPAAKTAAKKAAASKAPVKKAPVKKTPAKKAPAKKAPA